MNILFCLIMDKIKYFLIIGLIYIILRELYIIYFIESVEKYTKNDNKLVESFSLGTLSGPWIGKNVPVINSVTVPVVNGVGGIVYYIFDDKYTKMVDQYGNAKYYEGAATDINVRNNWPNSASVGNKYIYNPAGKFILPTDNTNQTIYTNNYEGRYICVKPATTSDGFTGISQIIVTDPTGANIAKGKPIFITSVLTWNNTTSNPSAVVDGSTTARAWPNFWHNSIGVNDFIEIDLGKVFAISSIQILTRNDGYMNNTRIPNTRIEINSNSLKTTVGNDPANGKFILPTDNTNQTINTNNYSGRYVCLKPAITSDGYTGISQIIVKDSTGANIAKGKPVYATGSLGNSAVKPSAVVDGTTSIRGWPNVWHNDKDGNDFIEIDLGKVYAISNIQILSRNDCCHSRIPNTRIEINSISLKKKNISVAMTLPNGSMQSINCDSTNCSINCNVNFTPSGACVLSKKQ